MYSLVLAHGQNVKHVLRDAMDEKNESATLNLIPVGSWMLAAVPPIPGQK